MFGALYSAATRDKYRVRLERGLQPGTTEVFLSHRGAEEVVQETGGPTDVQTVWKPRPTDPDLEIIMMRRLAVSIGVNRDTASALAARDVQPAERAQLTREAAGDAYLTLNESFARAWRRTGLALDRIGFTVEDRNRSEGLYYVRYIDPLRDANDGKKPGLLSKLAFWRDDEDEKSSPVYRINLLEVGDDTRVLVLDDQGRRENSSTAQQILTLLHEQLK